MYYIFPYDNNGNLYPHPYYGTDQAMSNPPQGWNVLSAIDDTDTTAQAAYHACESLQPQQYIVQNGTLVANPNWSAIELAEAVTKQIASIEAGYNATINAGFQFTVGTTTYTMGWREDATYHDQLHLSQVQQAIDKGVESFPVDYADLNGNQFSIPDQTTLTSLDTTATSFGWAQVKQLRSLVGQVKTLEATSGTTVAQIEAIVWSEVAY